MELDADERSVVELCAGYQQETHRRTEPRELESHELPALVQIDALAVADR